MVIPSLSGPMAASRIFQGQPYAEHIAVIQMKGDQNMSDCTNCLLIGKGAIGKQHENHSSELLHVDVKKEQKVVEH